MHAHSKWISLYKITLSCFFILFYFLIHRKMLLRLSRRHPRHPYPYELSRIQLPGSDCLPPEERHLFSSHCCCQYLPSDIEIVSPFSKKEMSVAFDRDKFRVQVGRGFFRESLPSLSTGDAQLAIPSRGSLAVGLLGLFGSASAELSRIRRRRSSGCRVCLG